MRKPGAFAISYPQVMKNPTRFPLEGLNSPIFPKKRFVIRRALVDGPHIEPKGPITYSREDAEGFPSYQILVVFELIREGFRNLRGHLY